MTLVVPEGYQSYEPDDFTTQTHPEFIEERTDEVLEPLDHQEDFLEYGPTYNAIISGIGAGKTAGLVQRIVLNAELWNPGKTGVVITPTVPSLRNVLIPELRKWGYLEYGEWQASKKRWQLPNGSTVIFESADNQRKIQRLRGPSIGWYGMDEPSTIAKEAHDIMVGRLRDGDYINAFYTGTPKGFNWVYDTFVDEDSRLDDVNLITDVETSANPHLPEVYTDEIVEQYGGQFYEQEVKGQFVKYEGLVYKWFDDENKVGYDDIPDNYDETIYGIDWGGTNPSVILSFRRDGDYWYLCDEFYERRCTVNDMASQLEELEDLHGPGKVYCDPAEPGSMEILRRKGFNVDGADNDVDSGIRHVNGLRDTLRVAKTCQSTINEFGQYQYKEGKDDPVKENDHAMDAMRYALFTHNIPDDGSSGTGVW